MGNRFTRDMGHHKSASSKTKEVSDLLVKFDTGTTFNSVLYQEEGVLREKNTTLRRDISQKLTQLSLENSEHFNAVFTSTRACKILTEADFSVLYAEFKDGKNIAQSPKAQENYNAKLRTCKEYIEDQIKLFKQALDSNKQELPKDSSKRSVEVNTMLDFFSTHTAPSPKTQTTPQHVTPQRPSAPTQSRRVSTPPHSRSSSSSSKNKLPAILEGDEPPDTRKKKKPN